MWREDRPRVLPLLFGLFFVACGLIALVGRVDLIADAHWVWPAVLVALGIIILAGSTRRARFHSEPPPAPPLPPAPLNAEG